MASSAAPDPTRAPLAVAYRPADDDGSLDEVTIGGLLRRVAAEVPQRTALVDGVPDPAARRRWTYAELLADAEAVAAALPARFEPGDRVAVWAPNLARMGAAQLGAALAGLVLVTVNPAYRAGELALRARAVAGGGRLPTPSYRGEPVAGSSTRSGRDLPELREVMRFSRLGRVRRWRLGGRRSRPLPDVAPGRPGADPVHVGDDRLPQGRAAAPPRPRSNNARALRPSASARARRRLGQPDADVPHRRAACSARWARCSRAAPTCPCSPSTPASCSS